MTVSGKRTVKRTDGANPVVYAWPDKHWDWPVALKHAHGVRSGSYLFTGGQAALNSVGEVVCPGDLSQQCDLVMGHIQRVLEELDGALSDLTRLVIYFVGSMAEEQTLLAQIALYLRSAEKTTLEPTAQPVINTVSLPALCYPGMRLEVEGVAMRNPDGSRPSRREINIDTLPPLPTGFSHVVHCGDVVFVSDLSAITEDGAVEHAGEIVAQTHLMMNRVQSALQFVGADASNVVKVNVYYVGDGTAENWTIPAKIRADFFPDPGPAATGITVPSMPVPGMMTRIAITAVLTSKGKPIETQYAWPQGHWDWTTPLPYKHGNKANGLIHLGGQVSLNSRAEVVDPDDIVAQTRRALDNIKRVLDELGASVNDIVKVTTFYQGGASAEGLHQNLQIRSETFGLPGPATSGIPVPHLVYPRMLIEIEVIAVVNGCA